MKKTNKSARAFAFVAAASLIVAACGDDDDGDTTATTAEADTATTAGEEEEAPATTEAEMTETTEAEMTETTEAEMTETTEAEGDAAAMTVTYTLSDVAVWDDGTPISAADVECTWMAKVNTPESIQTAGYDKITSVEEGASASEVVVSFAEPYAAWKGLFNSLLKADFHEDCADVSQDFTGAYPYGGNPYIMTEWTEEQAVYEKNPGYIGDRTGGPARVVIVPAEDGVTLLKAGTVDFIYPQAFTGIDAELADPNVAFDAEPGGQFEALFFMQDPTCVPDDTRSCAFADADYREAFSKSIDLEGIYQQIYAPFAQGIPLLQCGPIAPGPYCDPVFTDTYDPEGGAAALEAAGWTQDGSGMWMNPDGEVPEVHWMVNTGNTRRESTQAFLIPKLAELGFNVIADNCEATPCVFQTRLPAQAFDFAMYINTVAPDPSYISDIATCDQVPSEENNFQGQNSMGWCNEEASAALEAADAELDEEARAELVKSAIALMVEDHFMLPTLQFPNIGAYRTDKVGGTQSNLANYWAFNDWWNFEDLDGDDTVVLGAEQFPPGSCANPITGCANSSWFQWVAGWPNFPGLYITTNAQTFETTEFLDGEAVLTTG